MFRAVFSGVIGFALGLTAAYGILHNDESEVQEQMADAYYMGLTQGLEGDIVSARGYKSLVMNESEKEEIIELLDMSIRTNFYTIAKLSNNITPSIKLFPDFIGMIMAMDPGKNLIDLEAEVLNGLENSVEKYSPEDRESVRLLFEKYKQTGNAFGINVNGARFKK